MNRITNLLFLLAGDRVARRSTLNLAETHQLARRKSPDLAETLLAARRRSPDLAETADRRSPHRFVPVTIATVVVSMLFLSAVSVEADEPVPAPVPEVEMLVDEVTGDDDAARRTASEKLVQLGETAVRPLAEAAEVDNAEVAEHCFDVLGRLMVSNDPKTATAAKEALQKLSKSEIDIVGIKARNTLRLEQVLKARERLLKIAPAVPGPAGGVMRMTATENGKSIQLRRAADGSFEGKVSETVDGKKQITEIKAASEKELEEKFPEAHKAFQKQQKAQPPLGLQPAPAVPFGAQAQVQIFGAAGPANSTKFSRDANGNRTIEVQNGDEKIEIKDVNGKKIELKHTRPVDGKSKTDEYKADDLDDLKKKHPEAAKLYEKHSGAGNLIPGAGGIRFQINGGGGFLQVQPGLPVEFAPRQTGPRTIRSELDGRKIEVSDENGQKIRVKLTKVVDGKDVSQEFSADDLKTLQAEHPEAARLYEQLTGRKD
ncbi:MAG: hypothetical protein JSS49_21285 [Planctomycetes bacterium]|nr:hypothetical protein [Planctomycetota bacterium]